MTQTTHPGPYDQPQAGPYGDSTGIVPPIDPSDSFDGFEDYWGSDETHRFVLPDGKQWFDIKPLNEGGKSMFQKKTNKGIKVDSRTNDATLAVDPADERHTLILESVVGFRIAQRAPDGTFSEMPCPQPGPQLKRAIQSMLEKFNPKVIQDLEFFIRTKNPWMQADMNVEAIDEEIERLMTLRKQKVESEKGE